MLLINQRNDKLAASKVDFIDRGMLNGPLMGRPIDRAMAIPPLTSTPEALEHEEEDAGPVEGEKFEGEVTLARTSGEFASNSHTFTI